MSEEIGLFEAMRTQRAIRYFKPDSVPDELIGRLLEAAVQAPSGGNRQHWAFLVIRATLSCGARSPGGSGPSPGRR